MAESSIWKEYFKPSHPYDKKKQSLAEKRIVSVEICRSSHEYFISSPHLFIADNGMWRVVWRGFIPFVLVSIRSLCALCFIMWFVSRHNITSTHHSFTELVAYSLTFSRFEFHLA
jgi:hypothetical protein